MIANAPKTTESDANAAGVQPRSVCRNSEMNWSEGPIPALDRQPSNADRERAPRVAPHQLDDRAQHAALRLAVRALRLRGGEARGLAQPARERRQEQERDHAERVERAPAERQLIDEAVDERARAVADRADAAEHADAPAAVRRRETPRR